jgi:hypothetical protein
MLFTVIWFDELGPVVSIVPVCAAARPVVKLALTAVAAARRSNFLMIVTPFFKHTFCIGSECKTRAIIDYVAPDIFTRL